MQLEGQTGNIGHLHSDYASSGKEFDTVWTDARAQWRSDEFQAELDGIIHSLREVHGLLHNRKDLIAFAKRFPDSSFLGNYCNEYGLRVDTEKHSFLLRTHTTKNHYTFDCFCYVKEWLDRHISKAEQGIRFIDPQYQELFRIPDGDAIIVTSSEGEKSEYTCRFIDECHTEVGNTIYHICEFAERMERKGSIYEPKTPESHLQKPHPLAERIAEANKVTIEQGGQQNTNEQELAR